MMQLARGVTLAWTAPDGQVVVIDQTVLDSYQPGGRHLYKFRPWHQADQCEICELCALFGWLRYVPIGLHPVGSHQDVRFSVQFARWPVGNRTVVSSMRMTPLSYLIMANPHYEVVVQAGADSPVYCGTMRCRFEAEYFRFELVHNRMWADGPLTPARPDESVGLARA